jgi:hypothetical protein
MTGWDYIPWIFLGLALLLFRSSFEHFARFEDTSSRQRTDALINSSFKQQTNHAIPEKEFDAPIAGVPTPFRVNMYDAHL